MFTPSHADRQSLAIANAIVEKRPFTLLTYSDGSQCVRFHIVAQSVRTGARTRMTAYPLTHHEALTIMGKLTQHPTRRLKLEPTHQDA
jgi:hypothetical protein